MKSITRRITLAVAPVATLTGVTGGAQSQDIQDRKLEFALGLAEDHPIGRGGTRLRETGRPVIDKCSKEVGESLVAEVKRARMHCVLRVMRQEPAGPSHE